MPPRSGSAPQIAPDPFVGLHDLLTPPDPGFVYGQVTGGQENAYEVHTAYGDYSNVPSSAGRCLAGDTVIVGFHHPVTKRGPVIVKNFSLVTRSASLTIDPVGSVVLQWAMTGRTLGMSNDTGDEFESWQDGFSSSALLLEADCAGLCKAFNNHIFGVYRESAFFDSWLLTRWFWFESGLSNVENDVIPIPVEDIPFNSVPVNMLADGEDETGDIIVITTWVTPE